MRKIGWMVKKIDNCQIFIRQFPLIGSFIKIQRLSFPIPLKKIEKLTQRHRAFKIIIEPRKTEKLRNEEIEKLRNFGYQKSNSPYLPTRTIQIDLRKSEKEIFKNFSEAKRRGVKKAIKNGVIIKPSKDIKSFIRIKSSQFLFLGFLIKKDINALWQTFSPKNAVLLRARSKYRPSREIPLMISFRRCSNNNFLAGILLLFHYQTAHYWLAASTKRGNRLFAPSFLVWEALKLAKKRGAKIFDFEGIYDPRFHQATKSWQGLTRFKKGFGGKETEYPGCFVKQHLGRF